MPFRSAEQIIASWKHRVNLGHTAYANTNWYNELFDTAHQTYLDQAWNQMSPGAQYYAFNDGQATLDADIKQTRIWNGSWSYDSIGHSNVIPVEKVTMPLTALTGSNNQTYAALNPPQGTKDPINVVPSERMLDWINFAAFGSDFTPRIYWDNGSGTGPGVEITTTSLPNGWIFDPYAGFILCGSDSGGLFTPTGNLPIWLKAYRYIGDKGAAGTSGEITRVENIDVDIGSSVVDTFSEGLSDACVWFYRVKNGTNLRAGSIIAVWEVASDLVEFANQSTLDIGDTGDLLLRVEDVGNNIRLVADATSDNWSVRVARILI